MSLDSVSWIAVDVDAFEKAFRFSKNETYCHLGKESARKDTYLMYGYVNVFPPGVGSDLRHSKPEKGVGRPVKRGGGS